MTITPEDIRPVVERLARLLVVREIERQDVARHHGRRVKAYTEAVARLDGAADAVYRVVNGWGPQQILTLTCDTVEDVPPHTSSGRRAWMDDVHARLTMHLMAIYRDQD